MNRSLFPIVVLVIICSIPQAGRADDAPASAETQLRSRLRDTMLQLRSAQNDSVQLQAQLDAANATLKTTQQQLDDSNNNLKKLNEAAAKLQTEIDTLKKTIADQKGTIASRDDSLKQYDAAIKQWQDYKAGVEKTYQLISTERLKLLQQVSDLQHLVADREAKNIALYTTANDVLTRYEKFSFGDALAAKEPFTGIARTKLEAQVEDYKAKFSDSRVTPTTGPIMQAPSSMGAKLPNPSQTPKAPSQNNSTANPNAPASAKP